MRLALFILFCACLPVVAETYEITRLLAPGTAVRRFTVTSGQVPIANGSGILVGRALLSADISDATATPTAFRAALFTEDAGLVGADLFAENTVQIGLPGSALGSAYFFNPSNGFKAIVRGSNITGSDKTLQWPNQSGTVALTADIAALSGTYQPLDQSLTAFAAVGTLANTAIYYTGLDLPTTYTLTPAARTVLDDLTVDDMVNTLLPAALSIPKGGTGETNAADARIALGTNDAANLTTGTVPDARLSANLAAMAGIALNQNRFYARTASGSGAPDTAITIGTDFSLSGNTLALANAYQAANSHLTDLADGSLTGSKVGSGIDAGNVTAGTLGTARLATGLQTGQITYSIGNGTDVITTGYKGSIRVPYACTLTSVEIVSVDASTTAGAIVIDVWKDTYANFPPVNADSITASDKPTITATATKSQDTNISTWTTSVSAGDYVGFEVESVTSFTKVQINLICTKS